MSSDNSEKKTITLEPGTHWMCTCGKSSLYPMCDGSHKGTGKAPEKKVLEQETVIEVTRPE